ncbi:class I SAM-dependent methyltransferase [Brasilonema octagenarum]|uniref:SAM-dependent methyltransferase n=1 Tax=Brasilonema octagenarum UFV-OR1 TaxID=417115 RepID=A0ABX1M458_9CYAN|nr:class I SAM-dependent methyltransferase [Brasilonema octagenarum]NMF61644.1 SAM-dependent methyltransferase [Brasilonema octagenarum UFV-OR1]
MQDPKQQRNPRYSMNLEQRKTWYSPVADVYYKARAPYSQKLINRAVTLAQLSSDATILEVGCGPGNATVCFAQLGFSMICLKPNQDFYYLAQRNCAPYSKVEICNTSFEEWELEAKKFNAVLSANAFHWIPPEIGYSKAAEALQDNGSLILLWNMTPEPRYEVYQAIEEVYQAYAPSLAHYEGAETQADILRSFGQNILNSGYFRDLVSEQIACEVTYSIDNFLNLLSTLRSLDPQTKDLLFKRLREKLEDFGENIQLSYLCAVQIARKDR